MVDEHTINHKILSQTLHIYAEGHKNLFHHWKYIADEKGNALLVLLFFLFLLKLMFLMVVPVNTKKT